MMEYCFLYHTSPNVAEDLLVTKDPLLKELFKDLTRNYPTNNEAIKVIAKKGFTLGLSPRVNKFPCIDILQGEEFIARMAEPG